VAWDEIKAPEMVKVGEVPGPPKVPSKVSAPSVAGRGAAVPTAIPLEVPKTQLANIFARNLFAKNTMTELDQLYALTEKARAGDVTAQKVLELKAKHVKIPSDLQIFESVTPGMEGKRGTSEYRDAYIDWMKEKNKAGFEQSPIARLKLEMDYRQDFTKDKQVQGFFTLDEQFRRMTAAYRRSIDMKTGKIDSASFNAIDQTLVNTLSKMLDPGSVVRESEYARTPEGMSWVNKQRAILERFTGGGILTQSERKELWLMSKRFYEIASTEYDRMRNWYSDIVTPVGFDINRIARPRTPFNAFDIKYKETLEAGTSGRRIKRRGTHQGRPVVEYEGGEIEYAD
jgi:hypothetical protein